MEERKEAVRESLDDIHAVLLKSTAAQRALLLEKGVSAERLSVSFAVNTLSEHDAS